MRLNEIAKFLNAELKVQDGSTGEIVISRVAPIETAKEGEITFLANPDYAAMAKTTKATAIIIKNFDSSCPVSQVVHQNPYWAFAKIAQLFYQPNRGEKVVSEAAFIAADATIGKGVTIYPNVFIGSGAVIENDVVLYPGVCIGNGAKVGANSVLFPNVVVYEKCVLGKNVTIHAGTVIGSDGFGYAVGEGEIVKIPQVGIVEIEDDVEIGAACSIDRAAMGVTRIRRGAKIDNQCQIAHNVEIGPNCMLSAQTGIAGSTKLGSWVITGGSSGVTGHIEIASGAKVGGFSGVIKSITDQDAYLGFPAIPAQQWRRQQVYLKRLPEYDKRLKELEKKIKELL